MYTNFIKELRNKSSELSRCYSSIVNDSNTVERGEKRLLFYDSYRSFRDYIGGAYDLLSFLSITMNDSNELLSLVQSIQDNLNKIHDNDNDESYVSTVFDRISLNINSFTIEKQPS